MYLEHFGLREEPFRMTPDPAFFFPSKQHRAAIAGLIYLVEFRKGFGILTGGIGTGKTMLCRILLSRLGSDTQTALIVHPPRRRRDLLQAIIDEFQIPDCESKGTYELIDRIQQYLIGQLEEGKNVVLVIDEAQHLDAGVLEEIRMLSNMETEKEKILQIILVGQEELNEQMASDNLRQLRQRVVVNCHLEAFSLADTTEYIQHRIDVAGLPGVELFELDALHQIHQFSEGVPRVINAACDRCLLAAYAKRDGRVTDEIARSVLAEFLRLHREPAPLLPPRKPSLVAR